MNRKLGFSLIEIVVIVAIIGILTLVVVTNGKSMGQKSQVAAVAKEIGAQLSSARAEAQRTGIPVGLAFPGDGTFVSQGFYKLRGTQSLRVEKIRSWKSEFPLAYVTWGRNGSEVQASNTLVEPFDLSTMTGIDAADPCVLFLPNGKVLVDGLSSDGQDSIIRVGAGPSGSGNGRAGAIISALNDSWEIRVGQDSAVTAQAKPQFPASSNSGPWTLDVLPGPAPPVTTSPVVSSITTEPELTIGPSGDLLLSGPENKVQLNVVASSPEGVPLYVRWTKTGGQFSNSDDWFPMVYSRDDNSWKASTLWSLPPSPSTDYTVGVEVRDQFGNITGGGSGEELAFDVQSNSFGIVSASVDVLYFNTTLLESLNGDGSNYVVLDKDLRRPPPLAVSPDGNTIAYAPLGGGFTSRMLNRIEFVGRDGSSIYSGILPDRISSFLGWTNGSTRLVVSVYDFTTSSENIYEVPVDGSPVVVIDTIPENTDGLEANDDFSKYAYYHSVGGAFSTTYRSIKVYDSATGTITELLGTSTFGVGPTYPILSPTGAFLMTRTSGTAKLLRSDGSGLIDLGTDWPVAFSPDENFVLHYRDVGTIRELTVSAIDGTNLYTIPDYETVAFSPDSSFFVYTTSTYELRACDTATGVTRLVRAIDGRRRYVKAVSTQADI